MKQKSLKAKKTLPIFLFVLAVFLIIGVHVLNPTPASGQQTPGVYTMKTPPASMDKLYPPQSQMPVWLLEMFKLASFYMSVGNDAQQGDWANAQQVDPGLDEDDFRIAEAHVGRGPVLKRYRPRARGGVGQIRKPSCHITIVISDD